jgi:hypothetical protein
VLVLVALLVGQGALDVVARRGVKPSACAWPERMP